MTEKRTKHTQDLVRQTARRSQTPIVETMRIIRLFLLMVRDELVRGNQVSIQGLGRIWIRHRMKRANSFGPGGKGSVVKLKVYPKTYFKPFKVLRAWLDWDGPTPKRPDPPPPLSRHSLDAAPWFFMVECVACGYTFRRKDGRRQGRGPKEMAYPCPKCGGETRQTAGSALWWQGQQERLRKKQESQE